MSETASRSGWMMITIWNEWLHSPSTVKGQMLIQELKQLEKDVLRGHPSPGYLHLAHVLSYGLRQMPHISSSGMSHRQAATASHCLILTFMSTDVK